MTGTRRTLRTTKRITTGTRRTVPTGPQSWTVSHQQPQTTRQSTLLHRFHSLFPPRRQILPRYLCRLRQQQSRHRSQHRPAHTTCKRCRRLKATDRPRPTPTRRRGSAPSRRPPARRRARLPRLIVTLTARTILVTARRRNTVRRTTPSLHSSRSARSLYGIRHRQR